MSAVQFAIPRERLCCDGGSSHSDFFRVSGGARGHGKFDGSEENGIRNPGLAAEHREYFSTVTQREGFSRT